MLTIVYTPSMKRDMKQMIKRGKDMSELDTVLKELANGRQLAPRYRDHALKGKWKGFRECHIEKDWLLVYEIIASQLILSATRTGSHKELLGL
ncbi:hypothetical protein AGMMS49992_28620 [Clostridia bacterium]|nr:hypothetical protein AGMMS49992_28620 [Clostridia bacterium]